MNQVSSVNFTGQQPLSSKKTLKHVVNAGITAASIAGTNYIGKRILKSSVKEKFLNVFEKLGEKIFKGKLGALFERYAKLDNAHCPKQTLKAIKQNKGLAAFYVTLGALSLINLGLGIYRAGKINGEN